MTDLSPRGCDEQTNETVLPSKTLLPSAFAVSSNAIACEAITAKLNEVSKIAESLDSILKELQDTLDEEQDSLEGTETQKNANLDVSGIRGFNMYFFKLMFAVLV